MRLTDAVPALFMIALSAGILLGTSELPYWADTTPGSRFFPMWLAGVGILLSAVLLLELYRGREPSGVELPTRSATYRVSMTVLGMAALALVTPFVGMVFAVALFMTFLLLVVLRQNLLPSLATALLVAVAIELIFVRWLGVSLPGLPFSI